ncbi:aminomethyl-transferring glycine dehydrogenase [Enemella evansiae]|uniref:aminomethyl-transferring glycine dehydrogenase n=1 Tax=Enemella evansiae TaxID=2016499 RepID=UPI000B964065|nr:aminomethyl-transferring glycine dehydrogenase [Enemella evansiae]OYO20438.1 glycine dehydrogenase (aminomethyl-transferring) [Enemella evansiae]TDO92949.1 glycine dehydrogenase (decarboxylating) alpha subunit /glycine dehydrogenase (decarboxylating) beta subunit [Enemella evansiae]
MSDPQPAGFAARHIGPDAAETARMLESLGLGSLDELIERAVPAAIRSAELPELPEPVSEQAVEDALAGLAALNNPLTAMIGLGYHGTITPAVIRRNVLEDPAWYTAYTPYQPEISQGRLEALLNFQTVVSDLTGLTVAGASLLDEGTAVAEAVMMARRATRKGDVVLLDADTLPQTVEVVRTRARAMGFEVVVAEGDLVTALQTHEAFAVVVQTPGASGRLAPVAELAAIADKAHENNALVIAAVDLLAQTITEAPASWGADIAVGSSQRFGVPLFYGGPHAGFIAVGTQLQRNLPGRLVGVSKDADGTAAYRLALQTREQHIRREKATSNICTAQVLLAVVAGMYACYHGPAGLTRIAEQVSRNARRIAAAATATGAELVHDTFFDTVQLRVPGRAAEIVDTAREGGVHLRLVDADTVGIAVGEDATEADLAAVAEALGGTLSDSEQGDLAGRSREQDFLTHPVFNTYHSETEMLRYLRALSDRDFALDRGMIPLGSCTMKLNATAELEPISYDGFANLHPFAPVDDAAGYLELIGSLQDWLAAITGYARVSIQPNAGSQGEFAGLMAIRAYHRANGDDQRIVCLIPSSAHGTNAASAAMAGMKVAVVKSDEHGSVDLEDLRVKIDQHRDQLAAIMITYPSTHGVYERTVTELCELVHEAGGQVYIDGANLNALCGVAQPGQFGGDVSHLNLHKTFCIPHGGGGPGVGPVAVAEHLVPHLPSHPLLPEAGPDTGVGPISASPFGSAGILPISWAYIAMMGAAGLRQATQHAVLAANYVAHRLTEHYPVLYAGDGGLVAHECILDLRPLTKRTGITVDDVAKRLIDYGFHAPTMSFPVAGTLMVEPTESESLDELDRFCDAMIAIRREIDQVAAGEWPADDNPLANAPHPLLRVTADEWTHPYSRTIAGYPAGRHAGPIEAIGHDKYWPAVSRIDGAYGDRNLICSCPPPEAFED